MKLHLHPSVPFGATTKALSVLLAISGLVACASSPSMQLSVQKSETEPAPPMVTPPPSISTWAWPSQGNIIAPFDGKKNKGIHIAGVVGDPVTAAADGIVIYAGSGLKEYGQFIILKHSNGLLTAYGHNRKLLVKNDDRVQRGQKIAEMGRTGATQQVKLHFEVRDASGKPVDPMRYLPNR